jgi:hypothetical protein
MKKFKFLMVFGICLVFCFLLTAGVFGQENIPTVTLPISNLLEVRKDLIRKEGNAFPGGWSEYYMDYKSKIVHGFVDEEAEPFDYVGVAPFTSETLWVEALTFQDLNFLSDEWAEREYQERKNKNSFPELLGFQIFLDSDSLNLLAKDDLRFIYQDSTGAIQNGEIYSYKLDETKKPEYHVEIMVDILPISNPQNITWFSLHILNKKIVGRVDMCWDFRKD